MLWDFCRGWPHLCAALKVAFPKSHYFENICQLTSSQSLKSDPAPCGFYWRPGQFAARHVVGDVWKVQIFCSSTYVISNERRERENLRTGLWPLFPFSPVGLSSQSRCALAALGTSTSCLDWAIRDSTVTSSLHSHISNLSVPFMTV